MSFKNRLGDYYAERSQFVRASVQDADERLAGMPIFFQGDKAVCLVYSVAWIGVYFYDKAWPAFPNSSFIYGGLGAFLNEFDDSSDGNTVHAVLDRAREIDLVKNYYFLLDLSHGNIAKMCEGTRMILGLRNFWLTGGQNHAVVLLEATENGYKCMNWSNKEKADIIEIPKETPIDFALVFGDPIGTCKKSSLPFVESVIRKIKQTYGTLV